MMMMIRWSNTEEVSEDWRQFHSEELIGLCSAPNIITVIEHRIIETDRPRGQATWQQSKQRRGYIQGVCGRHVGKKQYGRHRSRWDIIIITIIKIDLKAVRREEAEWI